MLLTTLNFNQGCPHSEKSGNSGTFQFIEKLREAQEILFIFSKTQGGF